ncbi:MAG: hypothetical protein LC107_09030 [Chitinophagales bacterium]|nr:hypothetical protein [Chitinophagales bacterium]
MKNKLNLLLVALVFLAIGCSKDKDSIGGGDLGGGSEDYEAFGPVLVTADMTEVEYNPEVFKYNGRSQSVTTKHVMSESIFDGILYNSINSRDWKYLVDIDIHFARKDNSTKVLSSGTYALDNPDFRIWCEAFFNDEKTRKYSIGNLIEDNYKDPREYNGESIKPVGSITITKNDGENIEGTFEFEAYTSKLEGSELKVIVKNGKFSGKIKVL